MAQQEKAHRSSVRPILDPNADGHQAPPPSPWLPGVWKRFPWTGIAALCFALCAVAVMIAVLVASNERPISDWAVQPSVLLALATTAANILIRYALAEGLTVAWWVKAMRRGTRVTDLHNAWAFGTSLKEALLSGLSFNLIALAGIAVTLAPISSPLLQRASTVTTRDVTTQKLLSIPIAQEFPNGYTGIITGRAHAIAITTSDFSAIVKDFNSGVPMNVTDSGCNGKCPGLLQGAGYAINCVPSTQFFNLSDVNPLDDTFGAFNGTNVFQTEFSYDEYLASTFPLNFTTTYKTNNSCIGYLNINTCTLQPALLQYHVLLTNDTVTLDPSYNYKDDQVVQLNPAASDMSQGTSTHGGMYLALSGLFTSYAHLRFTGAVGYELESTGAAAFEYSDVGPDPSAIASSCPIIWTDPSLDMLSTARELAFRTAIVAANVSNATNIQTMPTVQQTSITVFQSHYQYLGVALLFTLLAILGVAPTFTGWWRLGREVSLSPVEVAKAFNAPGLASSDSNAEAKALLKEVGGRPVRYGAISLTASAIYGEYSGVAVPEKLIMGDPGEVREPATGHMFVG